MPATVMILGVFTGDFLINTLKINGLLIIIAKQQLKYELENHACGDISAKYFVASYTLCDTFKVTCLISRAFRFIQNR